MEILKQKCCCYYAMHYSVAVEISLTKNDCLFFLELILDLLSALP